jgi:hypothetical protein
MSDHIHAFLSEWTTAERTGDAETLATLLADDFTGVGPLGFVLDRPAWLDRYRQGLAYEQFSLDEIHIRLYGEVAVVGARANARGTHQDRPISESLRVTLVIASRWEAVRLATVHMSFIAGTRGSPPMPAPIGSAESSADQNAVRRGR